MHIGEERADDAHGPTYTTDIVAQWDSSGYRTSTILLTAL
jgi:hypothetical protein